MHMYYLVLTE